MENTTDRKVLPLSVCLPQDLIRQLDAHSEAEGVFSRSAVIRKACMDYLRRWDLMSLPSVAEKGGANR